MKTEINNENKAKFFALYYDQFVLFNASFVKSYDISHIKGGLEIDVYGEFLYLSLKPLSQISVEDAIEVARISLEKDQNWKPIEIIKWDWCWKIIVNVQDSLIDESVTIEMYIKIDFQVNENEVFYQWDHNSKKGSCQQDRHLPNSISVYDYLRSRGYALPWMGLSVEEMIEAGWVKLI